MPRPAAAFDTGVPEDASGSDSDRDDVPEAEAEAEADGKSLYQILNVQNTATKSEIKRAYHKAALLVHPDKNPSTDAASNFVDLQKVYAILIDEERRRVYDETGRIDDDGLSGDSFENLYKHYRSVFKKVTEDDVVTFSNDYRGSDEEKQDVLDAYAKFKGDMKKVFEWVMVSEEKMDAHRFADYVEDDLKKINQKPFPVFQTWAAETRKKPAPKNPLKPRPKAKKQKEDSDSLETLILQRRETRGEDFFASLEAKYGGTEKTKAAKPKPLDKTRAKGGVGKKK
jgi:DnaJ family protein C protein 9